MNFGILKNEFGDNHLFWSRSCEDFDIDYTVIDMLSSNWLDEIKSGDFDAFLACPPGMETLYKNMYDEKIYILDKVLSYFVYPSYDEISIHENKKYLSYWLKAVNLPSQGTYVFYHKTEANLFIETCNFPIVGKINIGAGGRGVKVLYNKSSLSKYIKKAFGEGLTQKWGPNLRMGSFGSRILSIIKDPVKILNRLAVYKRTKNEVQKNYVILQDFVSHTFEWRIVKIGDSYFGHQKIKDGEKASGTKGVSYVSPPDQLLNFVRNICIKHNFNSMAVDVFEDGNGGYFINELQTIFGHVQDYICEQNGEPGRFIFKKNKWEFEAGLFNNNLSYDLRLKDVIQLLSKK